MKLVVMMGVAIVLLFVSMVFSAMAATSAKKKEDEKAHSNAKKAALVSGLSVLVLLIALYVYMNSSKLAGMASNALGRGQQAFAKYQ